MRDRAASLARILHCAHNWHGAGFSCRDPSRSLTSPNLLALTGPPASEGYRQRREDRLAKETNGPVQHFFPVGRHGHSPERWRRPSRTLLGKRCYANRAGARQSHCWPGPVGVTRVGNARRLGVAFLAARPACREKVNRHARTATALPIGAGRRIHRRRRLQLAWTLRPLVP